MVTVEVEETLEVLVVMDTVEERQDKTETILIMETLVLQEITIMDLLVRLVLIMKVMVNH